MKEEIVLKHLAKYYNRKGRTINNDDILPMSRILPMMDEYAQEYHKSQSLTQSQVDEPIIVGNRRYSDPQDMFGQEITPTTQSEGEENVFKRDEPAVVLQRLIRERGELRKELIELKLSNSRLVWYAKEYRSLLDEFESNREQVAELDKFLSSLSNNTNKEKA